MTPGQISSLLTVGEGEAGSSTGLFVGLSDAKPVGIGVLGLSAENTTGAHVGSKRVGLEGTTGLVVGAYVSPNMGSLVEFVVFSSDRSLLIAASALRLLCTVIIPTDVVVAIEATATVNMRACVATAKPTDPATAPAATPTEHEDPAAVEA